jgi:hypothetical protein
MKTLIYVTTLMLLRVWYEREKTANIPTFLTEGIK